MSCSESSAMEVVDTSTRAEIALLLCCARTHINEQAAERIRHLLHQSIDWTYLIQTASKHQVVPLLYRSLSNTCSDDVPKPILAQLRTHFHANALRNLLLTAEL